MNSDDELFNFTPEIRNKKKELAGILENLFENTQTPNEIKSKHCKSNSLLNFQFNYKKFIYPTNDDILEEMSATYNPMINSAIPNKHSINSSIISNDDNLHLFNTELREVNKGHKSSNDKENLDLISVNDYDVKTGSKSYLKDHVITDNKTAQLPLKETNRVSTLGNYQSSSISNIPISTELSTKEYEKNLTIISNSNLVHDSNNITHHNIKSNDDQFCKGFKSGSGHEISISYAAKRKGEELFECITKDVMEDNIQKDIETASNQSELSLNNEFKSSSELNLNISEVQEMSNLSRNKKPCPASMFQKPLDNISLVNENNLCAGFKSATGREIAISKAAKTKANLIFESINKERQNNKSNEETSSINENMEVIRFKFNSGTNISVPNESERKEKDLFEFMDKELSIANNKIGTSQIPTNKNVHFEMGFKSGTGRNIIISNAAERNAKKLFESINEDLIADTNKIDIINFPGDENSKLESGFKSGTGRNIHVSSEAERDAKELFESINEELLADRNNFFSDENSKFERGFESGTGRNIYASKVSERKEKIIFESNGNEIINSRDSITIENNNPNSSNRKFTKNIMYNTNDDKMETLRTRFRDNPLIGSENNFQLLDSSVQELDINDNEQINEKLITADHVVQSQDLDSSWDFSQLEENEEEDEANFHIENKNIFNNNIQTIVNKENSFVDTNDSFLISDGIEKTDRNNFQSIDIDESQTSDSQILEQCKTINNNSDYENIAMDVTVKSHIIPESQDDVNYGDIPSPIVNESDRLEDISATRKTTAGQLLNSSNEQMNMEYSETDNELCDISLDLIDSTIIHQDPIVSKTNDIVNPKLGYFSQMKKYDRVSLKTLLKSSYKKPEILTMSDSHLCNFHSCADIKFRCNESIGSLNVGDGGVLVPGNGGFIGIQQFVDSFKVLPNVDPGLISNEWIKNHFQMILWKLLSFENRFNDLLSPNWVSPHHIMLQLKYRYDKEIDNVKRPALRKIAEQDDCASKRLVLVVLSIENISNESIQILVSDGWYYVPAIFDKQLKDQIMNKKIQVGTKLITFNAIWTSFGEPIVLPLNSFPPNCGLKLHGNSTRRARSYAKLGYQANTNAFPIALSSLKPSGGIASLIKVIINRVYPIQYMETIHHENQENPQKIFRNERAEETARKTFDQSKELIISETVNKMFTSTSTSNKRQKIWHSVTDLNNGEDIMNYLNSSFDQESAHMDLSMAQQDILRSYKENLVADALLKKCPNRNVISLVRILVSGSHVSDIESNQVAMLTVWKPSEDLISLLVEGTPINIYSVSVTHAKLDIQFSNTASSIALNSISSTQFERNLDIHENLVAKLFKARQLLSVVDACQVLSVATASCEIDCIGIVTALSNLTSTSKDVWQHVVLSNPDNLDDGLILIKMWGGLQVNYLTNVVEMGNCVKFVNVQFRKSVSSRFRSDPNNLIFECHYAIHSNATYVKRQWNFQTLKEKLHVEIKRRIPGFRFSENDNSVANIFNPRHSLMSPLTKNRTAINHSLPSNIDSRTPFGPAIATSTPKRLGLSGKRVMKTCVVGSSITENDTVVMNASTVKINADALLSTGEITPNTSLSTPVDYEDYDKIIAGATIANAVKIRRRTSTTNVQYTPDRKKRK